MMFGPYNSSFLVVKIFDLIEDVICLAIKTIFGPIENKKTVNKYNKILICNPAHLGDVLYTLRIVTIIHKKYPHALIDMVCGSWAVDLVKECKYINKIYIVDHWKINRKNINNISKIVISFRTWIKSLITIRNEAYDVAVDFYTMFPSMSMLLYFSGIKKRIGYTTAGGSVLFTNKIRYCNIEKHIYEMQYECVKKININNIALGDVMAKFTDINIKYTMNKYGLEKKRYIVMHYGSGEPKREWSSDKWIKLINKIKDRNILIVMTGSGEREYKIIKSILDSVKNKNVLNLCNKLTMLQFMQIIKNAQLFLGCESFAGHIAAMYKINQISIMHGASKKVNWQPFGNNNCVVIRKKIDCLECQAPQKCNNSHKCMDIPIDIVFDKLEQFMENGKGD